MNAQTMTLAALATLRLTRFITTDTLGGWLIVEPAVEWATRHEGGYAIKHGDELVDFHSHEFEIVKGHAPIQIDEDRGWRSKLVSGLHCPHCVGYWIGAATLVTGHLASKRRTTKALFNGIAGSLGLSYITGHISQRLDD